MLGVLTLSIAPVPQGMRERFASVFCYGSLLVSSNHPAADSVSLLVGLPESWAADFSRRGTELQQQRAVSWDESTDALHEIRREGRTVGTAILAAIAAPRATSLNDSQEALEAAVSANVLAPQRLLSNLLPEMIARKTGRLVLVTMDPASQSRPEEAAMRASVRGIVTYFESLRPALRKRGVVVGTLLVSSRSADLANSAVNADTITAAVRQCLRNGTPQRILKVG